MPIWAEMDQKERIEREKITIQKLEIKKKQEIPHE